MTKKRLSSFICILLCFCLMMNGCSFSGDENGNDPNQEVNNPIDEEKEPEKIMDYTKYVNEVYAKPFWEGTIVYNETVCFMQYTDENKNKIFETATLAFPIEEIIAVMDYRLTKTYEQGKDYVVENGRLKLTEQTSIPYFTKEQLYPTTGDENYACNSDNGNYFLKSEGTTFPNKQIVVTYRHTEKWTGYKPEKQSEKFSKTLDKLNKKEDLNIIFYGDSIFTGCNSSSKINIAPQAEIFPEMITTYLSNKFGYEVDGETRIVNTNTSKGGTGYVWANSNVQDSVINKNPDLVFIGFGMNDRCTVDKYKTGMTTLVNIILEALPNVEIMLVSTTLPNPESTKYFCHQEEFEDVLLDIAKNKSNVAVVQMTSMHKSLLEKKCFRDMTGSGLNHPNDFLARIYAQTILKTLLG